MQTGRIWFCVVPLRTKALLREKGDRHKYGKREDKKDSGI